MKNLTMIFLGILVFTSPVSSFAKSKIQLAKDYVAIERIREARMLLDEAILEDPTNPKVHFGAGMVYKSMDRMRDANQAFRNAYKFDKSYGPKLSRIYETLGFAHAHDGYSSKAAEYFGYAIRYKGDRKGPITKELFQSGKESFSRGESSVAQNLFRTVVKVDSSYNVRISDMYYDLGTKSPMDQALPLFDQARGYSSHHNQEIGAKIIEYAKANLQNRNLVNKLRVAALKYLSKPEVEEKFPITHMDLPLNSWCDTEKLNKGEMSKVWWRAPMGYVTTLEIGAFDKKKFLIVLENGEKYNLKNGDKLPENYNFYFKILALDDNLIAYARAKE